MMQRASSMLVAGVPLKRGTPDHIEHDDNIAFTQYDRKGRVEEIHTPKQVVVRVHELMHARHTDRKRFEKQYKRVHDVVAQFTEDARLHITKWPWSPYNTPEIIQSAAKDYIQSEIEECNKIMALEPAKRGTWPDFAIRFRAAAVMAGLFGDPSTQCRKVGFADKFQLELARSACSFLSSSRRTPREGRAAEMLETAFFPPLPELDLPEQDGNKRTGKKIGRAVNSARGIKMEIIEMPHTEHIGEATIGTRIATSGSRLHRPSLRRPVLPQRIFIRRAPIEAGGTILVDASGSMGDWDNVRQWCEKAPFGTVAYYAGSGRGGWLYVYARDGKRAHDILQPPACGNTVDGLAIDWLMQQPGPRIMVTDREFCGAPDSVAQVARLANLERNGDIKVVDYSKHKEGE